jgi:hypothetical protein
VRMHTFPSAERQCCSAKAGLCPARASSVMARVLMHVPSGFEQATALRARECQWSSPGMLTQRPSFSCPQGGGEPARAGGEEGGGGEGARGGSSPHGDGAAARGVLRASRRPVRLPHQPCARAGLHAEPRHGAALPAIWGGLCPVHALSCPVFCTPTPSVQKDHLPLHAAFSGIGLGAHPDPSSAITANTTCTPRGSRTAVPVCGRAPAAGAELTCLPPMHACMGAGGAAAGWRILHLRRLGGGHLHIAGSPLAAGPGLALQELAGRRAVQGAQLHAPIPSPAVHVQSARCKTQELMRKGCTLYCLAGVLTAS